MVVTLCCVQSATVLQSSEIYYSQNGAQNIRIYSIWQSASCKMRLQLSNDLFGEPSSLVALQMPHQFAYEILLELETIHVAFTASHIVPKVFQKWLEDYLAHLIGDARTLFGAVNTRAFDSRERTTSKEGMG